MRTIIRLAAGWAICTGCWAGAAQENRLDADALARRLQSEDFETREAAGNTLRSEGLPVLPVLEQIARLVKDDVDARERIHAIYKDLRLQAFRAVTRQTSPAWRPRMKELLQACSPATREKLGFKATPDGVWWIAFETRTLGNPQRLTMLEYLVAPPSGNKDHELLLRMGEEDWPPFLKLWSETSGLRLRWQSAGQPIERELKEILPKATLEANERGLCLGPNRDEQKNENLPPDDTAVTLWVPLPESF